ncbi:hypothetical protein [Paraflavitalea pollutisoli]|uniref:hypothetical protein n=1 Tax=Paraflavitalea pollutisoli TaxID=3034143 RepID=UPI0023EA7A08|nr:hypothetical protein [Paraflavitalea sp. H1-2-19X]
MVIFFVAIFVVLTIFNRTTPFESYLQDAWMNGFLAFSLAFFGYIVFLLGAYMDFSKATVLFASAPFKYLLANGFWISYTATRSRFLFSGKRTTGVVDGFPVKIKSASSQGFNIYIGVDEKINERRTKKEIEELLKPRGLKFEDIFVQTSILLPKEAVHDKEVLELIEDQIAFLKVNGFEPRLDPPSRS